MTTRQRPLAATLLLACAAGASGSTAAAGTATLYVLREPSDALAGMNVELEVDGIGVVTLTPKTCAVLEPAASVRTLSYRWRAGPLGNPSLETESTRVALSLAPGRASYLRLLTRLESVPNRNGRLDTTTTWKMESVSEADVKPHLARCKPVVPTS